MLVTLTLVILLAAIIVFFSQEFIQIFKTIFAIKGVMLFLPLFIVSWLIFTFDYWTLQVISYCQQILSEILTFLVSIMPFSFMAEHVSLIMILTSVSVLPVYLLDLIMRKKYFKGYQYPNVTSIIIFIITALLLLML